MTSSPSPGLDGRNGRLHAIALTAYAEETDRRKPSPPASRSTSQTVWRPHLVSALAALAGGARQAP